MSSVVSFVYSCLSVLSNLQPAPNSRYSIHLRPSDLGESKQIHKGDLRLFTTFYRNASVNNPIPDGGRKLIDKLVPVFVPLLFCAIEILSYSSAQLPSGNKHLVCVLATLPPGVYYLATKTPQEKFESDRDRELNDNKFGDLRGGVGRSRSDARGKAPGGVASAAELSPRTLQSSLYPDLPLTLASSSTRGLAKPPTEPFQTEIVYPLRSNHYTSLPGCSHHGETITGTALRQNFSFGCLTGRIQLLRVPGKIFGGAPSWPAAAPFVHTGPSTRVVGPGLGSDVFHVCANSTSTRNPTDATIGSPNLTDKPSPTGDALLKSLAEGLYTQIWTLNSLLPVAASRERLERSVRQCQPCPALARRVVVQRLTSEVFDRLALVRSTSPPRASLFIQIKGV
ncbi:hypothetical protein J6590_075080 [Homalodisca vitripennis]|nr:hypothetical protein J6590_075080 [Homalodisca vitripennis]